VCQLVVVHKKTMVRHPSILLVLPMLCVHACTGAPPLRVTHDKGKVVIDIRTLGEYPTSVARVRLTELGKNVVVWELNVKSGEPQIDEIVLSPGANSAMLRGIQAGTYEIIVPKNSDAFVLVQSRTYTMELWGRTGRSARASFTL
jgi:hypothetical protein